MICLAILYPMQGAIFLGVVQVVVYTGAVMMLFLFVLMLVGVDASDSLVETLRGQRLAAVLAGLGFGILLLGALGRATIGTGGRASTARTPPTAATSRRSRTSSSPATSGRSRSPPPC